MTVCAETARLSSNLSVDFADNIYYLIFQRRTLGHMKYFPYV